MIKRDKANVTAVARHLEEELCVLPRFFERVAGLGKEWIVRGAYQQRGNGDAGQVRPGRGFLSIILGISEAEDPGRISIVELFETLDGSVSVV